MGPDNGLLSPVLRDTVVEIVTLPIPVGASPTFHGRDVFAPAAAALASGAPLLALGEPMVGHPERLASTEPQYEGKAIVGEVIYVDRFGTLVTNLTQSTYRPTPRSRSRTSTWVRFDARSPMSSRAGYWRWSGRTVRWR